MNKIKRALLTLFLFSSPAFSGPFAGCEEHLKFGVPIESKDDSHEEIGLCRLGYALSFDTVHKVPDWVMYHLTAEKASGSLSRKDNFQPDNDLPKGARSELSDYRSSGYDRGHMAPAADMKWSPQAMDESFLLSNMAPQIGIGFNRGIWANLEEKVREWAVGRGEIYVITGPIYDPKPIRTIGADKVSVPTHFYKIAFDPVRVEAAAFLLPNMKLENKDLPKFITSIDEVERKTGFDFLPELVDDVEAVVESKKLEMPQ
jgi:endonuclease G, mitochondrial